MKDEESSRFDNVGDTVEAAKDLLVLARAELPKKVRFEKLLAQWGQKEQMPLLKRSSATVHTAVGYVRGAADALGVSPERFLEALDGAEAVCAEYEVLFLTAHHAALADLRMRLEAKLNSAGDTDVE